MAETTIRAARLDAEGIYLGMDELPEGELTERHLPQVGECDLPPGRYRWSAEAGCFLPLEPPETRVDPDALAAIHAGFKAIDKAGIPLPPQTRAWMDFYENTWDGQ